MVELFQIIRFRITIGSVSLIVFLFGMALLTLGYTGGRHEGMIKKARRRSLERGTAVYLRMYN